MHGACKSQRSFGKKNKGGGHMLSNFKARSDEEYVLLTLGEIYRMMEYNRI